jgi:hypothetical protein
MVWSRGVFLAQFLFSYVFFLTSSCRSIISSCNRKLTVPLGFGYLPGKTLGVYRLVSTSPDQKASPLPEKDLPLPASRKHKVELRPSPVKPPPKSLSTEPRPSSLPRPDSAPAQLDVNEKPLKQPTSASESTASSPKYDYDAALRHSTLVPPPADASKAGRLWHQFKEIFVRSGSIICHLIFLMLL